MYDILQYNTFSLVIMHVFKSGSMCEVTNTKFKVPELPWPLFLPAPFHLVHGKNKCMMYVLRLILMSRCLDPAI
jgi:hypothetical protein